MPMTVSQDFYTMLRLREFVYLQSALVGLIYKHFRLNKQRTLELIPENNLSLDELINYLIQT